MMASLGVAIAIRGLVQLIWSGETQHYPRESRQVYHLPMDVRIPPDGIFVAILAVILVAGVYALLTYTKMGKAMRATSDNPTLALVSGINTGRLCGGRGDRRCARRRRRSLTGGRTGAAASHHGLEFLIPLFAAVILGGIGNPYALIGALVVGVSMELSTQWINPATSRRLRSPS